MRKFIVFICALFVAGTAIAETMCVKLDASKGCTPEFMESYQSNWSITCDGVLVLGVSYCSNQDGVNYGTKSETITSGTLEENKYCWCKMTGPAVSSWGFKEDLGSADGCSERCAYYCAEDTAGSYALRSALFSDLH